MKTAHYILTLVFVSTSLLVHAQIEYPESYGRNDRFAFDDNDFLYYQGDYAAALSGFSQLYSIDTSFAAINHRIGACLLHLRKPTQEALPYLEFAVGQNFLEACFDLAVAYHRSMKLEKAADLLARYGTLEDRDKSEGELARRIAMIAEAKEQVAKPVDVIIRNLGPAVNTEAPEYVPIIANEDSELFFTSRRSDSTAKLKDPNGEFFEDVYIAQKVNGQWQKAKNIGIPINTETHDAVVGTTPNGEQIILYRTNLNLTGGDLYTAKQRDGKWTEPRLLGEKVNTEYQEASACYNTDGTILYFSSNRPGGIGGKDIYRIVKLPNGEWSKPKNLGPTINTEYDEDSPFITEDGLLYFASSGHNTMGGYDLYRIRKNEQGVWGIPQNLGYPINTTGDDLFLSINKGGLKAYLSSDRPGGFGQQDLYEVNFIYRSERQIIVKGQVIDQSGNGISANIEVIDERSHSLQGQYRSNAQGNFVLIMNPLTPYSIRINAEGYSSLKDEMEWEDSPSKLREEQISPYLLIER